MPRKAKAVRWKKLREGGVLFVSSLPSPDVPNHAHWIRLFLERLSVMIIASRTFEDVLKTGDNPGGVLREQFERGTGWKPITAFVAVLTNVYLTANADRQGTLSDGELAHAVARGLTGEGDCETPPHIFLAPLDTPPLNWNFPIRGIALSDPRFVRLRDVRFTWPATSDVDQTVSDEIEAAVNRIVTEPED
jgi:hypothetical protein